MNKNELVHSSERPGQDPANNHERYQSDDPVVRRAVAFLTFDRARLSYQVIQSALAEAQALTL